MKNVAKTILLHSIQDTFQQQSTWVYRYLELGQTSIQTKLVLGMLRKLPRSESIQHNYDAIF